MSKDLKELMTTRARKLGNVLMEKYGYVREDVNSGPMVEISAHLALDLMEWDTGFGDVLFEVAKLAKTGKKVPMEMAIEAVYKLQELYDRTREDNERARLDELILSLKKEIQQQDAHAFEEEPTNRPEETY